MNKKKKRRKTRGPASCMYSWYDSDGINVDEIKRCHARALMAILTYPEKSKKRRPGDIFFAVQALGALTEMVVGITDQQLNLGL